MEDLAEALGIENCDESKILTEEALAQKNRLL
jgi:hypothetical protein